MKGIIFSAFFVALFSTFAFGQEMIQIPSSYYGIDENAIKEHVKILASDEFEGRAPASKGEELATDYIKKQFEALGLKPAGENGTYFQQVPLVGITPDEKNMVCEFSYGSDKLPLQYRKDYVLWTKRVTENIDVKGKDVIFAGYGVVAPEYGWNDFKTTNVKDKVIIVLINDPQIPDKNDPTKLDDSMFDGNAMTYYGRWTYKFEEAARQGCAGALIVHETGPAGYGWNVVESSNTGEQFSLEAENNNMDRTFFEGWITFDTAKKLASMSGYNIEDLKKKALQKDFKPIKLNVKANVKFNNSIEKVQSKNVVGLLEGKNEKLKNEYVLYSAHWDHLGICAPGAEDSICNGATDNAMGVAALFEIAKAFKNAEKDTSIPKEKIGPSRSVIFISLTSEEQGLLGSEYYGEHPIFPLNKTLAAINMDSWNVYGKTKDVTVIGYGKSTLDEYVEKAAAIQGRIVIKDPEPEKGFYYRADHFSLAKVGVPALYAKPGIDYIGKPADFGMQMRKLYEEKYYHQPTDEYKEDWDLSGVIEDIQLFFTIGYMLTEAKDWPVWKEGSEFKAIREASLKDSK